MARELPFPVRASYSPGKYAGCNFCEGYGCACCDGEAMKDSLRNKAAYDRQLPNGPESVSIPFERISEATGAIGMEALTKAFSEGGGGVSEVFDNLEKFGFGRPQSMGREGVE